MTAKARGSNLTPMPCYLVHHRHAAHECGIAFASFRGMDSVLRHKATLASCAEGGHAIWWEIEAATEQEALALLPHFVAARSTVTRVSQVDIP